MRNLESQKRLGTDYFIYYSTPYKSAETAGINAWNIPDCFVEILKKFNKKYNSGANWIYVFESEKEFDNDGDMLFSLDGIDVEKYKDIKVEYELPKVGEFCKDYFYKIVKVEKENHNIHKEIEIYKIYKVREDDIEEFESDKKEYSEETALSLNAEMEYWLLLK